MYHRHAFNDLGEVETRHERVWRNVHLHCAAVLPPPSSFSLSSFPWRSAPHNIHYFATQFHHSTCGFEPFVQRDRRGQAHRTRKVGGNGRGRRNDIQVRIAQGLVSAPCCFIVFGHDVRAHELLDRLFEGVPVHARSHELKGSVAVVEQSGIGHTRVHSEGRNRLVPACADRTQRNK